MNHPEKIQTQLAQETLSKLQEGFSVLDEKQLEEVVGAGWPLGLPGVQRVLGLPRANSAPGQLESAPFHNSAVRTPASSTSGSISGDVIVHSGWSPSNVLERAAGHL